MSSWYIRAARQVESDMPDDASNFQRIFMIGINCGVLKRLLCVQHGLQEAIQFCDLMITGPLEDILDSKKRLKLYPNLNLHHVITLLKKFK